MSIEHPFGRTAFSMSVQKRNIASLIVSAPGIIVQDVTFLQRTDDQCQNFTCLLRRTEAFRSRDVPGIVFLVITGTGIG